MSDHEIPWAGPPLLSDDDLIAILRESGAHSHDSEDAELLRAHLGTCNMVPAVRLAYAKGFGNGRDAEAAG